MVDIRAREILGKIRENPLTRNAIIAGKAVLYDVLEKNFDDDYAIHFPAKGLAAVIIDLDLSGKVIPHRFENFNLENRTTYKATLNNIKLELIPEHYSDNEEFGLNVLKTYDWGILKAYYESPSIIRDSEEFQKDISNGYMTLYNLKTISQLPYVFEQYNKINTECGGHFNFQCPLISLKKDEKAEDDPKYYAKLKKKKIDLILPWPEVPVPPMRNAVEEWQHGNDFLGGAGLEPLVPMPRIRNNDQAEIRPQDMAQLARADGGADAAGILVNN